MDGRGDARVMEERVERMLWIEEVELRRGSEEGVGE